MWSELEKNIYSIFNNFDKSVKCNYTPQTKEELKQIIEKRIEKEGPKCNLNDIDVSNVTDMSNLFMGSDFNGDISLWNVGNVKDMNCMFRDSKFNGDISLWNVCNVKDMNCMFRNSKFNQDISKWNVSNVIYMDYIFYYSEFNQDISKWNACNVENKYNMFYCCPLEKQKYNYPTFKS